MLIVCEGEVTEPEYLRTFRAAQGAQTVRIRVEAPGGDPQALVRRAVVLRDEAAADALRAQDENFRFDEVWCVFDVDEHARLQEAVRVAAAEDIRLAVSNPCFELWLLLHFADHGSHAERKRIRDHLRKHLPAYGKHVRFEPLSGGYEAAVKRAAELDRRHEAAGTQGGNPSTGVYRLTERIRQFGKTARM